MDTIDLLLGHDRWATEELLQICATLSDEQLDAEFDIGHRTLRATFWHMIENDLGWTAGMQGRRPDPNPDERASIAELAAAHDAAHGAFATFARSISSEGRTEDTFTDYFGHPMTFGGAILHLILHNAEHRTEVVHILTRLGHPDPEVDYGGWDFVRRGYTG